MKPPELTDEQYHSLDAIWGNPGKEAKEHKHIGWFFWLQFENDGNAFMAEDKENKMYEFYSMNVDNSKPFGEVYHDDGTKVVTQTIEDHLSELGIMWMIRGRKWNRKVVGYGYKKAYIEI